MKNCRRFFWGRGYFFATPCRFQLTVLLPCAAFFSDSVLKLLLTSIQEAKLSGVAAASIRRLCVTCSLALPAHLPNLLQLVQSADQMTLSNSAVNLLIEGIYHDHRHDKSSSLLRDFAGAAANRLQDCRSRVSVSARTCSGVPVC